MFSVFNQQILTWVLAKEVSGIWARTINNQYSAHAALLPRQYSIISLLFIIVHVIIMNCNAFFGIWITNIYNHSHIYRPPGHSSDGRTPSLGVTPMWPIAKDQMNNVTLSQCGRIYYIIHLMLESNPGSNLQCDSAFISWQVLDQYCEWHLYDYHHV